MLKEIAGLSKPYDSIFVIYIKPNTRDAKNDESVADALHDLSMKNTRRERTGIDKGISSLRAEKNDDEADRGEKEERDGGEQAHLEFLWVGGE